MLKSRQVILLGLLACVSEIGFCAENYASQLASMVESSISDWCHDKEFISCLGIAEKLCKSISNDALNKCHGTLPKFVTPKELENNLDLLTRDWFSCVQAHMQLKLKLSDARFNTCTSKQDISGESTGSALPPEVAAITKKINEANLSELGVVDTSGVTLPIYKNAVPLSRTEPAFLSQIYGEPTTVTAIMFTSSDTVKDVAEFYKKKLKSFRHYKLGDDVLFAENGPTAFDTSNINALYAILAKHSTVFIENSTVPRLLQQGVKSTITIGFKR